MSVHSPALRRKHMHPTRNQLKTRHAELGNPADAERKEDRPDQKFENSTEEVLDNDSNTKIEKASRKVHEAKHKASVLERNPVPICILIIAMISLPIYCLSLSRDSRPTPRDPIQEVREKLQKTQSSFQDQFNFTWTILNKMMDRFMKMKSPKKPITLLILGTENNREIANCLSRKIQSIVTSVIDKSECDKIQLDELPQPDDILKEELDSKIQAVFQKPCHAVVVEDIDHMQFSGLTILQPYSDDTSPHKHVIIILTATTKARFPDQGSISNFTKSASKLAREHLEKEWKKIHRDYRDAFLSRFLENVAVTKTENLPEDCSV